MRHSRNAVALLAIALTSIVSGSAPAATPPPAVRPNIVLILTDDLDTASMPFLPRLKSLLADQGTTFSNFIISDSLCCPSRSSILRGQYDHNHHVLSNGAPDGGFQKFQSLHEGDSTLATWLQAAGYRTILLGKYLNGYPGSAGKTYVPPGWSDWYSPVDGTPYAQYDYTLNENGRHTIDNGHADRDYLGDVLTARAVKFISRASGGERPFFVYLAPYSPHRPYTPARRHLGAFDGASAPRPASFNEGDVSDKPLWYRTLPLLDTTEIAEIDDAWRKRLESMLGVEDMVASVIDALAAAGQLDNTYIFFTSDNGYHMGVHRLLPGKRTPYEEDIRVPMIVRGPGVPSGATLSHLVGNVDLAPTITELAGATAAEFVDGLSLARLLAADPPASSSFRDAYLLEHLTLRAGGSSAGDNPEGAADGTLEPLDPMEAPPRPDALEHNTPPFTGLRLADSVYVEYDDGEKEMYDLRTDPDELVNSVSSADPALVATLSARLAALKACAEASCR
ncbi:MAG: sulfatase [Acidobacteria bacterium]|nr:sulfatase [Acidobacteriota bacterium]